MAQHLIGVISDTHGLLRPQAVKALKGVELIVHAGDIGGPEVLSALEQIAPVLAVRGNTDRGEFGDSLPLTRVVEVGGLQLYVLHELFTLDLDPAAAGLAAVIFGHSHRPHSDQKDGVLYLNPGSAGPRRFTLDLDPAAAGLAAVIFGHSHRPHQEQKDGVLYLNPGSAGPRRFTLPVTLAILRLVDQSIKARIISLLE